MVEIPDIVWYELLGCFMILLKYTLVRNNEPINTNNKSINGANDTNTLVIIFENDSSVLNFASFKTNNINVVTEMQMDINANILPITELDENELIVIIRMVIPPAINE